MNYISIQLSGIDAYIYNVVHVHLVSTWIQKNNFLRGGEVWCGEIWCIRQRSGA